MYELTHRLFQHDLSAHVVGVCSNEPLPKDGFTAVMHDWCGQNQAGIEARYGKIEEWDTSRVTDMSGAFDDIARPGCDERLRNVSISDWDTSSVTSMKVSGGSAHFAPTERCFESHACSSASSAGYPAEPLCLIWERELVRM